LIDRRLLGAIEFLTDSGLDPTISGLACGRSSIPSGADAATGASMDISEINRIPVQGHQGAGSITDIAIRRLLTLQGVSKPQQIISLMSYKGRSNVLALPNHANRVEITYTTWIGHDAKPAIPIGSGLRPGQWMKLIARIGQIPEPAIPAKASRYALHGGNGAS
jgi:hypothetical protein